MNLLIFASTIVIFLTSCGQNHHITQSSVQTSAPPTTPELPEPPAPVPLNILDDISIGTSPGLSKTLDLTMNDSIPSDCAPVTYAIVSQNNLTIAGTAPNYIFTPTSPGPWDAIYSVTCADGRTDEATVTGSACEAQKFTYNTLSPVAGDQFYTPSGSTVTHIRVKAWGGGGGGGESIPDAFGGAGGYSEAILNSANYLVVVADRGLKESALITYGGGGAGGSGGQALTSRGGSSGGGLSGLFSASSFASASQGDSMVIAPGGGGGGIRGTTATGSGGPGGFIGADGIANSVSLSCNGTGLPGEAGLGGTQFTGGLGGSASPFVGGNGTALSGGSGFVADSSLGGYHGSGGGGGGYYGGGAGGTGFFSSANRACEAGGGGGSGFVSTLALGGEASNFSNSNLVPQSTDPDYIPGVGIGGTNGAGGNGFVVIEEICSATNTNSPHAFIDRASTSINTPININVISNDVDVDGDLDSSTLSILVNAPATDGNCVPGTASGELSFTPATAFTGETHCEYQVCDSSGTRCSSSTAYFDVN